MSEKKIAKKLIAIAMAAAMCAGTGFMTPIGDITGTNISVNAATATVYESGNYRYTLNDDGTVTIVSYIKGKEIRASVTNMIIPESLGGKTVTAIGKDAFSGSKDVTKLANLTSVTIPATVVSIEKSAFSGCGNLKKVTFAENSQLKNIGPYAFNSCKALTSIEIPASVSSLGESAFGQCSNLEKVVFLGASKLQALSYHAFFKCKALTSVVIPNSMTTMSSDTFYDCDSFTVYGRKDSNAEKYAKNNNKPFVELTTCIEGFAQTCTEDGKKDYYYNNFDGKDYEDYDCTKVIDDLESWIVIPATGHSYELIKDVAPTCTEDGEKVYKCSECNDIKTEVVNATGHSYKEEVIAPTCTEQGYVLHTCEKCNNKYKDTYTNATGHSYKEEVIAPTCTEQGYVLHTCEKCNNKYKDTYTNAAGHSYKEEVTAPTCTEKGYTTHTCSVCGDSYTDSYTEPTGHSYKEDVTAPTTEEEGYTLHTCQKCGDNYKDSYTPKLLANRATLSAENITLGKKITVTANATGGTGEYLYQVIYKQKTQSKWTIAQNYDTNAEVTFKPAKAVDYDVCVKVKDSNGTVVKKFFDVKVNEKLANTSALSAENIVIGQKVTANCLATGGMGGYQYQVLYKQTSQNKWTTAQDFDENTAVTFKPSKTTTYDICIKVKDSEGTVIKKFFTVQVNAKLANTSDISSTEIKKDSTVTVSGSATGGMGDYQYQVLYKQTSQKKWTVKQDFDANSIVSVKPAKATDYDICVKVKDTNGTIVKKYFTVNVTE